MEEKMIKPLKQIDLTDGKHIALTVPLMWIAAIFAAGFMMKPKLPVVLDLVTRAEAAEQTDKVVQQVSQLQVEQQQLARKFDTHITEFRVSTASAQLNQLQAQLERHNEIPVERRDQAWRTREAKLQGQVDLASQYTSCLVNEQPNCHLLLRQLTAMALSH